jgi:hypothetical protein
MGTILHLLHIRIATANISSSLRSKTNSRLLPVKQLNFQAQSMAVSYRTALAAIYDSGLIRSEFLVSTHHD